jgi:predicted nuclease with RNAse H fold
MPARTISRVTTAGVDLASQVDNTAACVIDWSQRPAPITELHERLDDDGIVRLVTGVTKVGVDVPLGWPRKFVQALELHSRDGSWPADYEHAHNRELRYRQTDIWLQDVLGFRAPLSVSTDRISIPAMRAAAVLNKISPRHALDGSGAVVEVYPAAALHRWDDPSRGYKGAKNAAARRELVTRLRADTTQWLQFDQQQYERCCANDNVFDAVIAALVARASQVGLTEPIPDSQREAALREGWIVIPLSGSLARLSSK